VVLVHDVSFFAHPEWFGWREGLRRRWLTRASARRARAVVTVSGFSRGEIDRYLGVGGDRVVLAPPGSPPPIRTPSVPRAPVVLHVGSLFQRRHLPEMIEAFALVARTLPAARFVLIGDNRTSPRQDPRQLAAAHGIGDRVEWRDYVSDEDLDRAYRSARAFLFLSDYEGFAMTPLEAAARGVPSVLLDTPATREVYGHAALRVPLDPTAIAAALRRLLEDDAAHAAIVAEVQARLASYSWSTSAATILRTLTEARR
jgi:glycosyltransferase involved in cell wall biosynthesis